VCVCVCVCVCAKRRRRIARFNRTTKYPILKRNPLRTFFCALSTLAAGDGRLLGDDGVADDTLEPVLMLLPCDLPLAADVDIDNDDIMLDCDGLATTNERNRPENQTSQSNGTTTTNCAVLRRPK
jgi:hypothetical protein